MTVTKEFVLAVAAGISALRSACNAAEADESISHLPKTAAAVKMVAAQIERDRQHADLLAGWVQRHRGEAGLSEEDVYV